MFSALTFCLALFSIAGSPHGLGYVLHSFGSAKYGLPAFSRVLAKSTATLVMARIVIGLLTPSCFGGVSSRYANWSFVSPGTIAGISTSFPFMFAPIDSSLDTPPPGLGTLPKNPAPLNVPSRRRASLIAPIGADLPAAGDGARRELIFLDSSMNHGVRVAGAGMLLVPVHRHQRLRQRGLPAGHAAEFFRMCFDMSGEHGRCHAGPFSLGPELPMRTFRSIINPVLLRHCTLTFF